MAEETKCPRCGKTIPSGTPGGLCPECMMKVGLGSEAGKSAEATSRRESPPPPLSEVARHFPQLEILELIGHGGMGAVYKARQRQLDRLVALKILPLKTGNDPGFAERFTREARALARLNHPNIVAVHEFGQANGLHYFIMDFVDGVNLRQLEQSGTLSARQALQIIPQICEALQYAHDEGIVHRDIKPENVLLDKKGRVKIADFGLAKILGREPEVLRLTGAKDFMGTPHYMAPEQVEHPQTVDHRADIYSLGVVFYEMLTGELPLGKFQPPSKKVEVDVRLDEVVLHTLEKEPERRYQHASEVKTDVETIAATPAAGDGGRGSAQIENLSRLAPPSSLVPAAVWGMVYFALLLFFALSASKLPSPMASHFGLNGEANGWMQRGEFFLLIGGLPVFFAALFWLLSKMAIRFPMLVNIPGRDVWFAPERRAFTAALLQNRMLWLAVIETIFFAGIHALTLAAHRASPPRLPMGGLLILVMGFFVTLLVWIGLLVARLLGPQVRSRAETVLPLSRNPAATTPKNSFSRKAVQFVALGVGFLLVCLLLLLGMSSPAISAGTWFYFRLALGVFAGILFATFLFVFFRALVADTPEAWRAVKAWLPMLLMMVLGIIFGFWSPHLLSAKNHTVKTDDIGQAGTNADEVLVEHAAMRVLAAIRDKDDTELKALATDERVKGWRDSLPQFAFELREKSHQLTGKPFDLHASESLARDNEALVKCDGPAELNGKYLALFFVKTADGWKNCYMRSAAPQPLKAWWQQFPGQTNAASARSDAAAEIPAYGTAVVADEKSQAASAQTGLPAAAEEFVRLLTKKDFADAVARFDATMKSAMPEPKMREAWGALAEQAGSFKKRLGTRMTQQAGFNIVFVTCEFDRAVLDIKVVFDRERRISGLWFAPGQRPAPDAAAAAMPKTIRETEIKIGDGEWALPGTLATPTAGAGSWPAVVLVHGSGPNDRDETVGMNKPFRDLAWGLAAKGVAVLRYDKATKVFPSHFVGMRGLTVKEETIDDALKAVARLRTTGGIDANRIFVAGHSLGGTVAPRIGAADSRIAGLIILAGPTRPLEEIIVEQTRYLLSLDGDLSAADQKRIADVETERNKVRNLTSDDTNSAALISGAPPSYWLDLRRYDAPATAAKLKQPLLIVQGARDYQSTAADFDGWKRTLKSHPNVTFRLYPDLNHLFITGQGKSSPAEYDQPGRVADEVINDIADWVLRR